MYAAKREHSTVVVYDPEHDYHSKRHLALTADLRTAIKNGQLTVHYQPKIAAGTGRTVGAEVLVRWRHPEHGVIAPDEFIPIAEQSGLIAPLALWVLETSLDQCAEWRSKGLDIGVCVNLSARNLLEAELPSTLMRLLAEREVPPGYLCLEITESVIMEDPKKALEVLTDISILGIEISVDDFGTGYSSLGYLRKLPADELKIDKSFVMEMDSNPDDAIIVRSTIDLAHNLGMRVVAEGVERPQVWAALQKLGCDYGQGYLFSRPIPAEEFGRWHQEGGWPAAVNA
jgi:EAL domain-containing protein (putative c-di-GMP-specific phosphodiesterase class I)